MSSASRKSFLQGYGLRATDSRLRILEILEGQKRPMSPGELLEASRQDGVTLDQVTIYRVLESFRTKQIVHEVHPGKQYLLCTHRECGGSMHVLIRCTDCGLTREEGMPGALAESMTSFLRDQKNFLTREHFMQIDGHCQSDCDASGQH